MSDRLKSIRGRHERFKKKFGAMPEWKAQASVSDIDYLLKKIDKLKEKLDTNKDR